ncbi:adenylyl cyclase X E [Stomoxys calcitrans]|uniref:adenylate cyclase n=1 Tax=Stomoxys calcitrans TaxID=35570 RepID=A0A1I8P6M3_STOCA|nr:adenylyl cyclase X E [Stomoxys calcitrans]XP_013108014.1 adenylyl cyclase X E [Stomoxys calcitrans]XP_059216298.1 adenylyl cyclase X E [Stomoxys calcitrans]
MNSFLEDSTECISRISNETQHDTLINEKKWEWGFLRNQCRNLELEQFYQSYMQRLRVSYLSLFVIIELLVVGVHSIILLSTVKSLSNVSTDIFAYLTCALLVWGILAINFRTELIKRYTWIMYVTSWLAVCILATTDIGISVYHAAINLDILRPAYGSYVLYAAYIFMPLPDNVHAFFLGMAATISYLIDYAFVTYRKHPDGTYRVDINKLITECIFLLSINMLGIYFRMMKEIAIRTTFLDRRQYVEENLLLRHAREEERSLLLSIIPAHIVNRIEHDVKARLEFKKAKRRSSQHTQVLIEDPEVRLWRQPEAEKLFIEPHENVSILYADVVNYTHLTTTLDVKTLVETLHDLFVKFDTASEEYNVLRIKFLGDCYYCVAGVSIPNEHHAKCCVDLGLRMIKDIRDVRTRRKLNIDMRIGVHTGRILSGVLGACKLQYDIWSKDVDIANRLEQTGMAGRVHVSQHTLRELEGEYMYEEGTAQGRVDPVLKQNNIITFLIKPPRYASYSEQRRPLAGVRRQIERNRTDTATDFMQNNIQQFNQIRTQAKLEMSRELDKMPIGRIQVSKFCFDRSKRLTQDEQEEQNFRRNITSVGLFFKDWRWEMQFLQEPDDMLKYSVIMGVIIFLGIMAIQSINKVQSANFWATNALYIILMIIVIVLTWFKKLWIMFWAETIQSEPENKFILFIFDASKRVQSSITARVTIYLLIIVIHCSATFIQLLDCNNWPIFIEGNSKNSTNLQQFSNGQVCDMGFNPWAITESLELTICMVFLFSRIPFILKFTVGVLISAIYIIVIFVSYAPIYEASAATNVDLRAEFSHVMVIIITLCIFHLMDRQTEFISKVDYNWKRQLQRKQNDAKVTNASISLLIRNILPSHVADFYISKQVKNELYYEEYDNVAVMFATIKNYDIDNVGLRVLNEIICDFDEVLKHFESEGMFKVEKIKVAGWTYMAACGLDLARSEYVNAQPNFRNSSLLQNGRRSHYDENARNSRHFRRDIEVQPSTSRASNQYEGHNPTTLNNLTQQKNRKISSPHQSNVVHVMAQFALQLMRTMHSFNVENLQCEDNAGDSNMLRIGISNGAIMAGVVGSSKPHYDIWGNAVNMASRMDSTGVRGRIQVTEDTAEILRTFNIKCTQRGMTYVKGRGEIPTYFVGIDDNLNFIPAFQSDFPPTQNATL